MFRENLKYPENNILRPTNGMEKVKTDVLEIRSLGHS
jgi:hypothetical protein